MLSAVRRGPVLARALRACAPRTLQSPVVRSTHIVTNFQSPSAIPSVFRPQVRLLQSKSSLNQTAAAQTVQENEPPAKSLTEFSELGSEGLVEPNIIYSITQKMGISTMSDVQRLTIPQTLNGVDTLAQAKTGTGKTIAFLIPVLQKIITNDPTLARRGPGSFKFRSNSPDIRAIIISPTRELAEQIAVEARKVAASTGIIVQTAVGGTRKMEGLDRIRRQGCHLLVATPGRLKDILSDPRSGVSAPNLDVFVLDEADRLLDDGFGPEIEEIGHYLPDPVEVDRQTLMFSATVPREVQGIVRKFMKPDFQFIKAVKENESPTHLRVPQWSVVVRGYENLLPSVLEIANKYNQRREQDSNLRPFKAIVYFNCTASVQLYYEVLASLLNDPMDPRSRNPFGRNVYGMHSKLSQQQRTAASDNFRRADGGILISSDVTARGMDFPDVTHVIQIGLPRDRESYIHRLGRTARADKEGEGWIILHEEELGSAGKRLRDLSIKEDASLETAGLDLSREGQEVATSTANILNQVSAAMKLVDHRTKSDAYRAELSYLSSVFSRKRALVHALNELAVHGWKLPEPPAISRTAAQKLGLAGIPALKVSDDDARSSRGFRGDAFGDAFATQGRQRIQRSSYGGRHNAPRFSDRQPDQLEEFGFGKRTENRPYRPSRGRF
ncbi:putative DEAD box RNA helicase hela [Talaromyces proteolyticus]|uniref:ATP-dependent RNA helicase n=1 Tax=Talaromyces proteolyticus TaxID=1131652 RepID=A0AAD4KT39_9EURO|nr:putative DEAD box RNA helicase hela [Talaromyces proteolyticus]KAH8698746.1 putative DEAD box RNA helicase hela [Talaromyces proteolyticus]